MNGAENSAQIGSKQGPVSPEECSDMIRRVVELGMMGSSVAQGFPRDWLNRIVSHVAVLFKSEGTIVDLKVTNRPRCVYSDLHGDIRQLLLWFKDLEGQDVDLLFLGDYVDRGKNAIELLIVLFLLKISFPDNVHLLRGNHETPDLGNQFGRQCRSQLGKEFDGLFNCVFDRMPIIARLDGENCSNGEKIYCVHGGVSPWMELCPDSLEKLAKNGDRRTLPETLMLTDILWSDPDMGDEGEEDGSFDVNYGACPRGIGVYFKAAGAKRALAKLGCNRMIRGHTQPPEGFKDCFKSKHLCLNIHSSSLNRKENNKPLLSSMARVHSTTNSSTNPPTNRLEISIKTSANQKGDTELPNVILWADFLKFFDRMKTKIGPSKVKCNVIDFYLVPLETSRRSFTKYGRTCSHRILVKIFEDAPKSRRISLSREDQGMRAIWIIRGLLTIFQNLPNVDISFLNGGDEDFDYYIRLLTILNWKTYNIRIDDLLFIRDTVKKFEAMLENPNAINEFEANDDIKKRNRERKRSWSRISF
ncbi:unnamed protein product [Bursaphelenchus xylophilus]|nr:unnamed protein product [Bursaphelenchus xylophilus]CAG9131597.1 unnamed protein product [Bursaphelenchus xylophilus]